MGEQEGFGLLHFWGILAGCNIGVSLAYFMYTNPEGPCTPFLAMYVFVDPCIWFPGCCLIDKKARNTSVNSVVYNLEFGFYLTSKLLFAEESGRI